MINAENQLQLMLAQPRFRQAIALHAKSNPEKDPIKRVHQAVGSIAPHLADLAAQHAQASIGMRFKPGEMKQIPTSGDDDEAQKVSKSSVNYRPGSVAQHCGNCSMYRNTHTCTLVRGVIDPSATCSKWEAQKKNSGVEQQSARLVHTQKDAGANPASATKPAGASAVEQGGRRSAGDNNDAQPPAPTFQAHPSILSQAKQAPDGHHYVPDPNRPGKFARVVSPQGSGGQEAPGSVDPATLNHPGQNMQEHGVNGSMAASKSAGPGSNPGASANMREVELIRHGSTDLNSEDTSVDVIRGHKDVPLNAAGKTEALKTAQAMAKSSHKPDVMVSSDLCRAKLTAQIISKATGIPVGWISEHFRPWDAGQLTGKPSKHAVPIMAQYAEQRPDEPLPGGESFHTFLGRLFIGIDAALSKHPNQRIGIVSHHRDERALHAWRAKGFPLDGSIDHKVFSQKGEKPGASQTFQIPVDRVRAVAQRYQNAAMAEPPANKQIQDDQPGQE